MRIRASTVGRAAAARNPLLKTYGRVGTVHQFVLPAGEDAVEGGVVGEVDPVVGVKGAF